MRRFGRSLSAQEGVTLAELMVTLMVVGILIGIAAPAVQNHIALQEIRGSAREVVDVLRTARATAMDEGVPRYVQFLEASDSYRVYRYSGAWTAETGQVALNQSVDFADADVTFPQLNNTPVSGATVPENAAYFDTRGQYPYDSAAPESYTVTLHGGVGRVVELTVYRSTGQVTGL